MKSIYIVILALTLSAAGSMAQSNSYQALKEKFNEEPDVHSFSFSGWMGRLILNMAGEHEFRKAIKNLDQMRVITIPRSAFSARQVSVKGFKKLLKQDSFEELACIRDHSGEVFIYLREGNNHKNHYFVLIEEEQEVVAIELKGYLDPKLLNPENTTLSAN